MLFQVLRLLEAGNWTGFLTVVVGLGAALLIAISVHEFAHAWMADQLGDPTPRSMGRLTLNPLAHLDPLGTLMVLVAGFGWGKPVPINPNYLRTGWRRGGAMVSLAGPASNIAAAALFAVPIRLSNILGPNPLLDPIGPILMLIVQVSVMLAVFNLLPIAPLDGFKVAVGILPPHYAYRLARYEPYGPMILLLVLLLGNFGRINILGLIMGPPIDLLISLLVG
jgi:Zn-dependent protease